MSESVSDTDDIEVLEINGYSIRADVYRDLKAQKKGEMLRYICYTPVNIDDLWRAYDDLNEQTVRDYKDSLMDAELIREVEDGSSYKTLFTGTEKGNKILEAIQATGPADCGDKSES